ncbi:MAG TPA: hypothetical protein VME46_14780, partial [Acidimicrobiales bacterium]|nr:hypothetical protein [Acidimicrobiales bacterium]
ASGNPADYPAAQPRPPSLAGAYSTNMMTAIITLVRYEDWVWSHPNPLLVANYMVPGTRAYVSERRQLEELVQHGWHSNTSPSEIDWIWVLQRPQRSRVAGRKAGAAVAGTRDLAIVVIIVHQRVSPFLDDRGDVVGHSQGGGRNAFNVLLTEARHGHWRISSITKLPGLQGLPQ